MWMWSSETRAGFDLGEERVCARAQDRIALEFLRRFYGVVSYLFYGVWRTLVLGSGWIRAGKVERNTGE